MIPRRIYEHVKSHNWFAVGIDFVIVVVGVFIGIQVSNWNAERHEKHAARTYIERMREDIAASARSVENAVKYYRAVKTHALAALKGFEKPEDELGEQFLIDAYQAQQGYYRPTERSTYDEILSAGAMNSIRNLEVRRQIVIHYKTVEATEASLRLRSQYGDNLRRYMPYTIQEIAFERCRPNTAVDASGFATVTMRENCDLGLPSEAVAAGITAIRISEIRLDLVRRLAELDQNFMLYQRLAERGQALDEFLAEAEM
jgi:hypothetical protein